MTISVMDKYKDEFRICFAQAMQKNLMRWKKFQSHYIKNLYTKDLSWYFFGFLSGFIPGKRERDYFNNLHIHFLLGVILFIAAIVMMISIENKSYQDDVKSTFFKDLLKIFGKDVNYKRKLGEYTIDEILSEKYNPADFDEEKFDISGQVISTKVFNDSELFRCEINERSDDDAFWGNYNNVEFMMTETRLSWHNVDKNGNRQKGVEELFKGLAMQFKLNKLLATRILIYSKTFGNKPPKGYEKVDMEYEKFNKKYNVYAPKGSKGQIEARYLFNTAFLERFMQIQTSFKVKKIQCSIKNNKMLILLFTNKDLFEMNHLFGKIDDVNQYSTLFDEFASVLSFIDVLNLSSKTRL